MIFWISINFQPAHPYRAKNKLLTPVALGPPEPMEQWSDGFVDYAVATSTETKMPTLKLMRLLGSAALLAGTSAVATAQTQSEPRPPTPPSITTPAPSPNPATGPSRDKPAKTHELVGSAVLSSDGSRVGTVHKVAADPDGRVTAIQVKAGGFLGFGGRLVIVPEGKFARKGESIQLAMTADEVSKLPETKEQS